MALALARAGFRVFVHGRTPRPLSPELDASFGGLPPWLGRVRTIILAVPDAAVTGVATELAHSGGVRPTHTVLHLSGVLDRGALRPLEASGAALGSLHPLQTLADPLRAPEQLRGAGAAIEGDDRARVTADALARAVGLEPFTVRAMEKARYHAGAVFASNYLVVLVAVAERLFQDAGVAGPTARHALRPLVEGAIRNLGAAGPDEVLTGPVTRGDWETVLRHLAVLGPADGQLYRLLGREALRIAKLDPERRAALERALGD